LQLTRWPAHFPQRWYRRVFPTRLSPLRAVMPEFDSTAQGCRLATSVGGVLTAHGLEI
jgi:hypothetical protein